MSTFKQAGALWKAPPITLAAVREEVNHYWSPRQNRYDPTMMGGSMSTDLAPLLVRSFEFKLAGDFFFSRWNKAKSEEIQKLTLSELAGKPILDSRIKPENVARHLQLTVFNPSAGSSMPGRYWGGREYPGMVRDLIEARNLIKGQFPGLIEVIDWLNQHIVTVDTIRKTTEAMINKAVMLGLKKLNLDDPSKYGGPRRTAGQEHPMSNIKRTLQRIASAVPESRALIVPILRRHAACACGDEMLAAELDEMFAADGDELMGGRKFDPHDPSTNKDYAKDVKDPGKWLGDNKGKGKCYYETGDPKDRCYVTTNGGPGGQTKPDTGSSKNKAEYNKKYIKQRWPGGVDRSKYKKAALERMAAMEAEMAQLRQASRLAELREARVPSKMESMGLLNDLRKKHGNGTKAYYEAVLQGVKSGAIAPAAVVGGGYKDGKKVAIKWLENQAAKAK